MSVAARMLAGGCEFSPCRRWRYTLWRTWQPEGDLFSSDRMFGLAEQYLMVIGLNPSTADEQMDDPTIRRCIAFAKKFGFGALCMTNLFGWRSTSPQSMILEAHGRDVIGAENDYWLQESAKDAGMIIAAWGTHGPFQGRAAAVVAMLRAKLSLQLQCFRLTRSGEPEHPLYLPGDLVPIIMP